MYGRKYVQLKYRNIYFVFHVKNCCYGGVGVGWWNNNRRILSKYLTPPAEGVLSVKRKLTLMLRPQIRPVLPAGRVSGECWTAVILGDEGCSSTALLHGAPLVPPLLRGWAEGAGCAPVCVSPARVWDRDGESKGQTRRHRGVNERGNMQMLRNHLSVVGGSVGGCPSPLSQHTACVNLLALLLTAA